MLYASYTDKGRVKKFNQDSAVTNKAATENGEILFSAVCDGMGGLNNGELASAEVVMALQEWFENDLPLVMKEGLTPERLRKSLTRVIVEEDEKISQFSSMNGDCGTTLAGVFLCAGHFLCVNVGDSRVYRISRGVPELLTHDQTVVQDMLDNGKVKKEDLGFFAYDKPVVQQMISAGKLTPEQVRAYTMKNTLVQCIGVEGDVVPAFTTGTYEDGDLFLLCSDGFRHKLGEEEFPDFFPEKEMTGEKRIKKCCIRAVEENIARGERDNITVIVIRT